MSKESEESLTGLKAFFEKRQDLKIWEGGAPEMLDTETEHYALKRFEGDDQAFLNALQAIYNNNNLT